MNKFPIVQHVRFGSLLRMDKFVPGKSTLGVDMQGRAAIGGSGRRGAENRAPPPAVPKFAASDTTTDAT